MRQAPGPSHSHIRLRLADGHLGRRLRLRRPSLRQAGPSMRHPALRLARQRTSPPNRNDCAKRPEAIVRAIVEMELVGRQQGCRGELRTVDQVLHDAEPLNHRRIVRRSNIANGRHVERAVLELLEASDSTADRSAERPRPRGGTGPRHCEAVP